MTRLLLIVGGLLLLFGGDGNPFAPNPIDAEGLHILAVEESGDRANLTRDQLNTLEWLPGHCESVAPGAWRILDDDPDLSLEDGWVRQAMSRERSELPWLIVSGGARNYEGPLPSRIEIAGLTGSAD